MKLILSKIEITSTTATSPKTDWPCRYKSIISRKSKEDYMKKSIKGENRSIPCLARASVISLANWMTFWKWIWIEEENTLISLKRKSNFHGPSLEVETQVITLAELLSIISLSWKNKTNILRAFEIAITIASLENLPRSF